MKTYLCKLIPPRPTFVEDMSDDEARLMQAHAVHWRHWMDKGHIVAFGVVADPAGGYGVGIVEMDDDAMLRAFTDNDPTILSDRGFRVEVYPMPRGAVYPARGAA